MWLPAENLDPFNRLLVRLEQDLLAVLRGTARVEDLGSSPLLHDLFRLVDGNPHQAVLMTRIKSGHAMTPRHGINVMLLARAWAVSSHKIGNKLFDFSLAALLHDIGHWFPDDLVYVFGPFTHDEARSMREHVTLIKVGSELLTEEMRAWIRQHHEQPDGRGYPLGIDNPSLLSQVLRIADCFEGLTTPRRFRPPFTPHKAMTLLSRWAGYKFGAGLFRSFEEFMGRFPPGSFIRLEDGRAGVTLPGPAGTTECLVLADKDGDTFEEPVIATLSSTDIRAELQGYHGLRLPERWAGLRPDLMGLPRFY